MSEDKTEILGNIEPTEDLEAQKAPDTKPMLQEILAEMREGFAQLNKKVDALAFELNHFRDETAKNFRGVDRKFDVLNNQMLKVHADVLDHNERLEDLERKAS